MLAVELGQFIFITSDLLLKNSNGVSDLRIIRNAENNCNFLLGRRRSGMTRYLISFDDGAMAIPEQELAAVGEAAHAVVLAAQEAGVWIFGGGVQSQRASIVTTDGTIFDGPYPETKAVIGGFVIVDVPSRETALEWAAKFAAACRCAQEVREIMFDPLV